MWTSVVGMHPPRRVRRFRTNLATRAGDACGRGQFGLARNTVPSPRCPSHNPLLLGAVLRVRPGLLAAAPRAPTGATRPTSPPPFHQGGAIVAKLSGFQLSRGYMPDEISHIKRLYTHEVRNQPDSTITKP